MSLLARSLIASAMGYALAGCIDSPEVPSTPNDYPPTGNLTESASIPENTTDIILDHTLEDPDGQAFSYTITGGADATLFTIDASTGNLAFIKAPNYEKPNSSEETNLYKVDIAADNNADPVVSGSVEVEVTDVFEDREIFADEFVTNPENSIVDITYTIKDANGNEVLIPRHTVYVTGDDAGLFFVSEDSLRFYLPPDYEAPKDADGDNLYELTLNFDSAQNPASLDLQVNVTDISSMPKAEIVFPTPSANLMADTDTSITITVRANNLESGGLPALTSSTVNGSALQQNADFPELWTTQVVIPAGESQLQFNGVLDGQPVNENQSIYNQLILNGNASKVRLFQDADDDRMIIVDDDKLLAIPTGVESPITPVFIADISGNDYFNGGSSTMYDSTENRFYQNAPSSPDHLRELDLDTGETRTFDLSATPTNSSSSLAGDFENGFVYISHTSSDSTIDRYNLATGATESFFTSDDAPDINWGPIYFMLYDSESELLYIVMSGSQIVSVDTVSSDVALVTGPSKGSGPSIYAYLRTFLTLDSANGKIYISGNTGGDSILEVDLTTGNRSVFQAPDSDVMMAAVYDTENSELYTLDSDRRLYRENSTNEMEVVYSGGVGSGVNGPRAAVESLHYHNGILSFLGADWENVLIDASWIIEPNGAASPVISGNSYSNHFANLLVPEIHTAFSKDSSSSKATSLRVSDREAEESIQLGVSVSSSALSYQSSTGSILMTGEGKLAAYDISTGTTSIISDADESLPVGEGMSLTPIYSATILDEPHDRLWVLGYDGLGYIDLISGDRELLLSPTELFQETWTSENKADVEYFSIDSLGTTALIGYKGKLAKINLSDASSSIIEEAPYVLKSGGRSSGIRGYYDRNTQVRWFINDEMGISTQSLISNDRVVVYQ